MTLTRRSCTLLSFAVRSALTRRQNGVSSFAGHQLQSFKFVVASLHAGELHGVRPTVRLFVSPTVYLFTRGSYRVSVQLSACSSVQPSVSSRGGATECPSNCPPVHRSNRLFVPLLRDAASASPTLCPEPRQTVAVSESVCVCVCVCVSVCA